MSDLIFDIGRDLQRAYDEGYEQGKADAEQKDVPDTNIGELISRQTVLDLFAEKCDTVRPYHKVWRAVKELPSVKPEKCGDCISRRVIIGKCEDTAKATSESGEINTGFIMALDYIADYAKHMPSVEPERKPGHWEDCSNAWMCSECKHDVTYTTKYCPNCGAPMVNLQESEEV